MSEKGFYKKLVDKWFDDDKSQQRARENEFYENAESEKVGRKPKAKPKDSPRADHKHDYKPVIVWYKSSWNNSISGYVGYRCAACGKKDNRFSAWKSNYNAQKQYYGELEHFKEDEKGNLTPIDKALYKKTIFLGGSKIVNELSVKIKNELIDYMNLGYDCIIGDCMGADYLMQKFLAENEYKNVTVYYSGERARVNLGGWREKRIFANRYDKGYDFFKRKDEQMVADCDEAFMILHGEMRGTMSNIERTCKMQKACAVAIAERRGYYIRYFCGENDFIWLREYLKRLK